MQPFIYQYINEISDANNEYNINELKDVILQNPSYLFQTSPHWTCYMYAASKSLHH